MNTKHHLRFNMTIQAGITIVLIKGRYLTDPSDNYSIHISNLDMFNGFGLTNLKQDVVESGVVVLCKWPGNSRVQ